MFGIDVSVVIPTFHRERQVVEAIGSVLAQNSVSIEVLVLDDSREGSAFDAVRSSAGSAFPCQAVANRPKAGPLLVRNEGFWPSAQPLSAFSGH